MMKHKEVETVPYVELGKYAGVWYEIGRYPQRFEKGATHVTAEYVPCDGYLKVTNTCLKKGKKKTAKGKAFVVPDSGNAKLKVEFFWPFKGDYWIIELDKDYQWAVVSNRKLSSLWILYRKPHINNEILLPIVYSLMERGFNLARIIWTIQ